MPTQGPQTPPSVLEEFERGKCPLDTFRVAPLSALSDKETGSQVFEEGAKRSRMESAMTGRNGMPASYLGNRWGGGRGERVIFSFCVYGLLALCTVYAERDV